ncbi:nose resistant to fluoxetine protein 6-like [Aethina tumida]|uniref:nose resistant to fluoxetine protein 6-like n=1 Tax=Aethina tumida TaxID=116153 RepID=UPI0021485214|nr:nose resistant to fluoxetine protein 6-like [Aethina tumida]
MMLIIFFHVYQNNFLGPFATFLDLQKFITTKANMFVLQMSIAVDTFFTVAGILVTYNFMKNYDKTGKYGVADILKSYVHRYFRLTPVLLVMILLHMYILEYVGEGPTHYNVQSTLSSRCHKYWWSALLYVQNYVNPMKDCVPQSWYLSVDMQLFILSPFYLIILKHFPKFTRYLNVTLIFVSIIVPFYVSYVGEFPYAGYVSDERGDDYMIDYYMKTHCRFGVYVIGMICGYYIYQIKKEKKSINLQNFIRVPVWVLTISVLVLCWMIAIVFMGKEKDVGANAAFNSTFRQVFSLGLSSLVLLCVTGNGGFINDFLSLPVFQVLTKLSYSMYLVHYAETVIRASSTVYIRKFSRLTLFLDYCGDFTITLILSYFCVIMFEIPFVTLDKYLFSSIEAVYVKFKSLSGKKSP